MDAKLNLSIRKIIRRIIHENYEKLDQNQTNTLIISNTSSNDAEECLNLCAIVFSDIMTPDEIKQFLKTSVNWNISKKATFGDKIIGCYLFNEDSVLEFAEYQLEDLSKYKNLKGIQGLSLALLPEYRGSGIGKKLRDIPLHMNYDYIWGQHLKGLHNIDNWTKFGRRLVAESPDEYVTLMDLKKKLTEQQTFDTHHSFQEDGHTCGPTCIKMVTDYLGVSYKNFGEIINLCGCNDKTGTVDTGIKNALDKLKIKNQQNIVDKDEKSAMSLLNKTLDDGNVFRQLHISWD